MPEVAYFWLGEDGEVQEITKQEFEDRVAADRQAWQNWIDLKDLDDFDGTIN